MRRGDKEDRHEDRHEHSQENPGARAAEVKREADPKTFFHEQRRIVAVDVDQAQFPVLVGGGWN